MDHHGNMWLLDMGIFQTFPLKALGYSVIRSKMQGSPCGRSEQNLGGPWNWTSTILNGLGPFILVPCMLCMIVFS